MAKGVRESLMEVPEEANCPVVDRVHPKMVTSS
jgi:hypothetical protein